ncbi:MAG: acyl-CoA synthetase [Microbacterium sp.]|uniref:acyl-CoA synthetase n=1 Tax=Microbacterium sp. TaxID=51671 RepID=UPI0039E63715
MPVPENTATSAPASAAPRLVVPGVQLLRAALAAIAAVMITFSPDHSAALGLAVFSGFAVATALVLGFGAWMAYPAGRRWPVAALAVVTLIAGMFGGVPAWRTTPVFFAVVIAWSAVAGVVELIEGWRERQLLDPDDAQRRSESRDAIVVGGLGLVLAAAVAIVPAGYSLDYVIDEAGQFTLTGTTIAVGLFGAYAAIVAVYLGIAAFSPRRTTTSEEGA